MRILREGGLVCYPTDTVYGIGAAAGDDGAVRRLYAAKGRSPGKALPLLLGDASQAAWVGEETPLAKALAGRFWPGALTLVFQRRRDFVSLALAGDETVAVRVPDHPVVRALIERVGEPLAGTSANLSGQPEALTAEEVRGALGERVKFVLDGGRCPGGVPSTVVDLTVIPPVIRRRGALASEVEALLRGLAE